MKIRTTLAIVLGLAVFTAAHAADFKKPYSGAATERENVFAFAAKPVIKLVAKDKYEITFAVKGFCDATVGMIDGKGTLVRHLASGVLGTNAPAPFQKNSKDQKIYWNGKDDLGVYVKEPEKLAVRVQLGLNPTFDKRLGGTSPYNIPGQVFGMAADETGVYVWSVGKCYRFFLRKFDHDTNYTRSVLPPPASLPESKRTGMGYVEYEKGRKAPFGPILSHSLNNNGCHLPIVGTYHMVGCQPVVSNGRFYYANSVPPNTSMTHTRMFYINTDGSTDVRGTSGMRLIKGKHPFPHLAASPDGKWMYITQDNTGARSGVSVVWRRAADGKEPAKAFIGEFRKPGNDNNHLASPQGIDTDSSGRIYVCDTQNNRLQIFSPDGRFLKSVKADRARVVAVHKKTGGIYVIHGARIRGKSTGRLTYFGTFDNLKAGAFVNRDGTYMTVDSWSKKPRLWLAGEGELKHGPGSSDAIGGLEGFQNDYRLTMAGVTVWEHDGNKLDLVSDLAARAKKEDGEMWAGPWNGCGLGNKVFCDPVRETAYHGALKGMSNNRVFDLRTGKPVRSIKFPGTVDDLSFDKRGYMHAHLNPGFHVPGVARFDPDRAEKYSGREESILPQFTLAEVPYDYGLASRSFYKKQYIGVLPVKDQPGCKYFQDGIGANMRGDVAVETCIYYVPKFEDAGAAVFEAGTRAASGRGEYVGGGPSSYANFLAEVKKREAAGEKTYFIKRQPGLPLCGPTVWVYDATGELRTEAAVIMSGLIQNCQLDEDGRIYFVNKNPRMLGKQFFLQGQGGRYGVANDKVNTNPYTGTLMKNKKNALVRVRMAGSHTPIDPLPGRDPDLSTHAFPNAFSAKNWAWVDGADWLYAGASPLVHCGCSCPKQNFCTDWFKRSYLPEMYRYSIGIVDANGNLVLHVGRYGTFDDADKLGQSHIRFVSATDNYMVYEDGGERIVVLKLGYRAEEKTQIPGT